MKLQKLILQVPGTLITRHITFGHEKIIIPAYIYMYICILSLLKPIIM